MSGGSERDGEAPEPADVAAEAEAEAEAELERVNLFTVSAMRLHLPRGGMPPTPGTEPSMVQRFARRVRQAGQLLEAVRERLRGR